MEVSGQPRALAALSLDKELPLYIEQEAELVVELAMSLKGTNQTLHRKCLIVGCQHFRGSRCLPSPMFKSEDGGSKFLRNVVNIW